jgi:hypothetical protein
MKPLSERSRCVVLVLAIVGCSGGSGGGDGAAVSAVALSATGQTSCYDAAGLAVACTGTGQDGDLLAGAAWPEPRFEDLGDGTVLDTLTGLVWLADANCIASEYPEADADGTAGDGAVTWEHALAFVRDINVGTYPECGAGHADWRLPNVTELESLVDAEQAFPNLALGDVGFLNVETSLYWSSTTQASGTDYAWDALLAYGGLGVNDKVDSPHAVWPVRTASALGGTVVLPATGQTSCFDAVGAIVDCIGTGQDGDLRAGAVWPAVRFAAGGDGTVTDALTGLVWLDDANCIASAYPGADTDGTAGDGAVTWEHALAFVREINAGTYPACGGGQADWRLPNRRELRSLIDYDESFPALPAGHPFRNVRIDYYWTSTTKPSTPEYAWFVFFMNGLLHPDLKSGDNYLWPVRGGAGASGE